MNRPIRAVLAGLLLACSESPSEPIRGDVHIDGPETIAFDRVGANAQLEAFTRSGLPVRWSSSVPTVASVLNGFVTAVGEGSAYIIASVAGAADSVAVSVSQVAAGLAFLAPPEHAVLGEPFLAPVRLAIVDPGGTPLQSSSASLSVTLEAGANPGALHGTTTRAAVKGVATFDDLSIDAVGAGYRITGSLNAGGLSAESNTFDVVAAPDRVIGRNHGGAATGMLLDGAGASGPFDDVGRVVPDSVAAVIASQGTSNEVMAFTRGRPPVLLSAPWTGGTDTVAFSFPAPIEIPVTVWIIKGPWEQQRSRAASAIATTSFIWDEERMGLDFSEVEFVDATADPDAPRFFDLTLCNQQAQITSSIGKRAGRINIYYVGTVDGGTDRGRACAGGDFTIMAERSGHELLSHEIGHLFGLGHVDADERFDRTNVMHSASSTRRYLTEAQVLRQHYNAHSALRAVYAARTDAARTCGDFEVSAACPTLARRLFADGTFPADDAASPVTTWLLTTCVTDDVSSASTLRSVAAGAAAEELRRAFEAGPPARVLRELAEAELGRRQELRARLAAGERFGLDDATLATLRADLDTLRADQRVPEFRDSWRLAAVRGLAVVGGDAAAAVLRGIEAGPDARMADAARRALAVIR